MCDYLERTGRNRGDGKRLVGALSAKRLLVYAPLLQWYVNHGAVITKVYRTIDYRPERIFTWFVEQVTEARRTGDVDKSKALLATLPTVTPTPHVNHNTSTHTRRHRRRRRRNKRVTRYWRRNNHNIQLDTNSVINLSTSTISHDETQLLAKGLKLCPMPALITNWVTE